MEPEGTGQNHPRQQLEELAQSLRVPLTDPGTSRMDIHLPHGVAFPMGRWLVGRARIY